jgi:hypothetical protein
MTDELEQMKRFRPAQPPPTPAATQSAREQLIKLIQATASSASDVGGTPPAPGLNDSDSVRTHHTPVSKRRLPHAGRRRNSSRRRATRTAAALAVVCVGAALAIIVGPGSTSPPRAAAAVLQRLATVASTQSPVHAPSPGHYLYEDSTLAGLSIQGACELLIPSRLQSWIGANGSGRILQTSGEGSFSSAHDKLICERSHSVLLHNSAGITDTWWAPGCYSIGDASYLHGSFQDPETLLHKMAAIDGGPPTPAEAFRHVGDFLQGDPSPALRAAIYRAIATISGVRLLGATTDRLGRHGIGFALTSHGSTSELILDPHDSALLAEQTASAGQPTQWAVYRTTRIVNRIPSRSPGRLAPACTSGESYGHAGSGGATIMTGAQQTSR